MKITINATVHIHHYEGDHEELLCSIERKLDAMARTLQEVIDAVEASNTRTDSLIALFKGLKAQLKDVLTGVTLPPGVQAKVDAVFDSVAAQAAEVDEALNENVPPPAPPTP